jgi:hypothetical protein
MTMLTIHLPPSVQETMTAACRRAGVRETGGMLFGEHVRDDEFRVVEATAGGAGSFATFLRELVEGLSRLEDFFRRTRRDYQRFNYLGEWHSHPSFALHPSGTDDDSMFDIVNDPATGARFAVSIIVKLANGDLQAQAFVYFPAGVRQKAHLILD